MKNEQEIRIAYEVYKKALTAGVQDTKSSTVETIMLGVATTLAWILGETVIMDCCEEHRKIDGTKDIDKDLQNLPGETEKLLKARKTLQPILDVIKSMHRDR